MKQHGIQWLNMPGFQGETLNPIIGCSPISEGCSFCWAASLHEKRHKAFLEGKLQSHKQYSTPFSEVRFWPERLKQLRKWREPRMVFIGSMCDVFHEDVSIGIHCHLFDEIARAEQHICCLLTKRPGRMRKALNGVWPQGGYSTWQYMFAGKFIPNLWLGVTVCNQAEADEKIPILLQTPAAKRFVSIEPMLGPIDLRSYLPNLSWAIVGGERGPNARMCDGDWILSIINQCKTADTPVFVKQMGAWWAHRYGVPDDYHNWRDSYKVREWPEATR